MKEKIKTLFDVKLWKFLLVGVLNTIVGEGLKALLLAFTSLAPLPASAISTAIASVMSYFLNKYFTFKYKGDNAKAVLRFTLNIVICYVLSHAIALLLIYPILTGVKGGILAGLSLVAAEKKGAADYIATYSGSVLFVGFNYLGQRFFAFREEEEEKHNAVRRALHVVIPTYALFPLAFALIMNGISYLGSKLVHLIFNLQALDLTARWGDVFPFIPAWSVIYILSVVYYVYVYIMVARDSPEAACRLVAADFIGKLVCMIIFIAMPTKITRPEIAGDDFFSNATRAVYWIDTPTNLFPSLHCFIAWVGARHLCEVKRPRRRVLVGAFGMIGAVLIFASTVFTKQHVLPDVISGVAIAEVCYTIAKYTKFPNVFRRINERFMATRLGRYYDDEGPETT